MDPAGLKKLEKFFKKFPVQARQASAGVLNSLAFTTRKYDIKNINRDMIVRNKRFVESSLRVQTTKPRDIDHQVAYAGSINRPRFTGWKEQQKGTPPKRKRSITTAARGGSKTGRMKARAKLRGGNKFYKPEQFQGKSLQQRFQFMMRVMNTRGGGEFLISQAIRTKRGSLTPGLYNLKGHRITRYQKFDRDIKIRRNPWRSQSIRMLHARNDINKIWGQQVNRIVNKYK